MSTARIADDLQFAYWVPNVSGGLVVSDIEQTTDWGIDYNRRLAQTAEQVGFDYALSQVRYLGSYGAESQHESVSFSLALLEATEKLKVIAAVHPGFWQPAVLAKLATTASELYDGRFALNVVSGWLKDEFQKFGEPWLEHDERYRRSGEFLQVLRAIFAGDHAEFNGDFYRLHDYSISPHPTVAPELFQGGNSSAARFNGGHFADWYFLNGAPVDELKLQIDQVLRHAEEAGREVEIGVNGFVILEDTEEQAHDRLRDIISQANQDAVEGFAASVKQAGQSTADGKGMWANSSLEDLVQYNDGFRTGLIGTADRISERIEELRSIGADLVLTGHLNFQEEVERFGTEVIAPLRARTSGHVPTHA
ncbi:MAG: dimethyl sulfone monooxygenase SfnG [Corynebacterium variabile]|uniref:dimethylsulfone monooxygenase SfnG n=3 Tax=Corynebacterium variabile TaxID=1727 RepID=UPI0026491CDF|nr:dimethyl sulfone monooxygenase SfnG [Corynebacterium variabile]MDN6478620.1 dimethyl sulfone monooxygenase SfnG [Corynebacterium variabile]MDN6845416.1 dimethyl sulfone monooxygenase SfnG [Corynebacterium variabile]